MTKITILYALAGSLWLTYPLRAQTPPQPISSAPTTSTLVARPSLAITYVANPTRITSLDSLLAPHRGRVVYIDFWGTWCLPCRKEMPFAARLKEKLAGEPIDFLYVANENGYDAKRIAKWKATIQQLHITGKHFMMNPDFEGGLSEFLEVDSYPRYVIIDKWGEILNDDAPRPSQMTEVLRQLQAAADQ